jgi:hypothetical protein
MTKFVRVVDEYINTATIERVTVRRNDRGIATRAELHVTGQYGHILTLDGDDAAALVVALDSLCVGLATPVA